MQSFQRQDFNQSPPPPPPPREAAAAEVLAAAAAAAATFPVPDKDRLLAASYTLHRAIEEVDTVGLQFTAARNTYGLAMETKVVEAACARQRCVLDVWKEVDKICKRDMKPLKLVEGAGVC